MKWKFWIIFYFSCIIESNIVGVSLKNLFIYLLIELFGLVLLFFLIECHMIGTMQQVNM